MNTAVSQSAESSPPDGLFGFSAAIKSGSTALSTEDFDIEFSIPFDDDLEPNEAEIVVYNLSDSTVRNFKVNAVITVEAGFKDDTGVIFKGFIYSVSKKFEGADSKIVIKALDSFGNDTIESMSFAANTTASSVLKKLLEKTKLPIAVFAARDDYTYTNGVTVDGSLASNIKKYSQVCGISTFVKNGKIYAQYIKNGDNINFTVQESTGMINSPEPFQQQETIVDTTETVNGYSVSMLLQHRMSAGAIINVSSLTANGKFRVRKGSHSYNPDDGAITEIEII